MKLAHNNFDGFLFWVHNGKENMEAGTICFEVRIPIENYHGTTLLQIDV